MGYKDEMIKQIDIKKFKYKKFDLTQPYVLLIQRLFKLKNTISDDNKFQTQRGMITKKYKRDITLQNLDLYPNEILWDIGSGSGSCAIEAYKRYKVSTILFEKNLLRAKFIKENLKNHYVLDSLLVVGKAEELFETIKENPNKIFIGGGGKKVAKMLPYLYSRLIKGGIILINMVTMSNLTEILNIINKTKIDYEIYSLSYTTYKGRLKLSQPERQLFSIKIIS
jgi:precorrin-6Y C5,15-methyltransferase (decarboxylating)